MMEVGRSHYKTTGKKKNEIPYNYPFLNIRIHFKDNTLVEKNFYSLILLYRLRRKGIQEDSG